MTTANSKTNLISSIPRATSNPLVGLTGKTTWKPSVRCREGGTTI